eukprot:2618238-Pleurochrysis_carterae.AAC.1
MFSQKRVPTTDAFSITAALNNVTLTYRTQSAQTRLLCKPRVRASRARLASALRTSSPSA